MPLGNKKFDESLPFFAYGIFKTGQLAFKELADLVDYVEASATVSGVLYERDGLPLLQKNNRGTIKGALITFRRGLGHDAYHEITKIEPDTQYKWSTVKVTTKKRAI